jgi:hypothetical protein
MTQAEYDAEVNVIEQEQARLTALMSVADLVPKDWALSGFTYKHKMNLLDAQLDKLLKQLRFSRFMLAERQKEKRKKRESNGKHRTLWSPVDADLALALKQKGFNVRCIGVSKWEVQSA